MFEEREKERIMTELLERTPTGEIIDDGVVSPRRHRRRWYWAALAATLPVAVAGTSIAAGASWLPETSVAIPQTEDASAADVATVTAPGAASDVDVKADIPQISVSHSPEPEPVYAPVYSSRSSSSSKSSSSKSSSSSSSSGSTSSSSGSSVSYTSYCAAPASPYSAGSGAKSLLTAVNKERARIGLHSLGWSSSLASSAQSWSENMAASWNLAHSGRGAENVGYTRNSAGLSLDSGISIIHKAWMRSNGHCLNVMYPGYSVMGAGAARTSDGTAVYATENFG